MTIPSYIDHKYDGQSLLFFQINNWLQFLFFVKAAALKQ